MQCQDISMSLSGNIKTIDWSVFDATWYAAKYGDVLKFLGLEGAEVLEEFYREKGPALRHSPNPYFDEDWYLRRYPAVAEAVGKGEWRSGFDHYCQTGFSSHNPHWLFDREFYFKQHPTLQPATLEEAGFRNLYDHYLNVGDEQFLTGSWFFNATAYLKSGHARIEGLGAFAQCVRNLRPEQGYGQRLSWYFDPEWYLETYPHVRKELASGRWLSALHHYLSNSTPTDYNPNAYFSEEFYGSVNHDVSGAVESGNFRNFYEHFLRYGVHELRKPSANIDLESYYRNAVVQKEVTRGDFPDAFAHYIAHGGRLEDDMEGLKESEALSKKLYHEMCRIRLPVLLNQTLDFTYEAPDLSVIIVAHNLFAMTMSALASLRANYNGQMQVIVVDSGSTDGVRHIERYVRGLDVVRFPGNVGFLLGCNAALEKVRGPFTLYLNNDTELMPEAIGNALARLRHEIKIGAVGGKLVRTNGLLQEAGSIVWRDGSVCGYLRDQRPDVPEANFVRSVDYCAGAFLMIRTPLLRQLGGFDIDYAPAYFEETDLCLRIHEAGFDVVYDPSVVVIHYEYGTSSFMSGASMIARNQDVFRRKHTAYLRQKSLNNPRMLTTARFSKQGQKRVLFIEDRLPYRFLGSGFTRSNDIVRSMIAAGCQVTVYPVFRPTESQEDICMAFPDRAEVIWDRELPELEDFIKSRAGYYDAIWIARTHNADRLAPVLMDCADALTGAMVITDTEAVSAPREYRKMELRGQTPEKTVDELLKHEFRHLFMSEKIIAVNSKDSKILNAHGFSNVHVLGHLQNALTWSPGWEDRRDILFLGAMHDQDSPNVDSLAWFSKEVLPLLDGRLPEDVKFTVCGYVNPRVDLTSLINNPRIVVTGRVEDVTPVYNSHRVFVAPTRYAAGIPYKLHEAAAHGIPVVATDILCEQVGWVPGEDMLCASVSDAQGFADAIVRLYEDKQLWDNVHAHELKRISTENTQENYIKKIKDILEIS
ncbi:glycosyltransferase [Acetobacter oryzifermentans]|uniref:glycosyltransferase n=1 Tax=Acetobacter oryzifermentans TaxID=1633874 RepID=UPI0039BF24B2